MKVFTCKDFEGHYPVGRAAVIVAPSKNKARQLLLEELGKTFLNPHVGELTEVGLENPTAIILNDGDY
jgi:hypothetical protein